MDSCLMIACELRNLNAQVIAGLFRDALAHQRHGLGLPRWRWLARRLSVAKYHRTMARLQRAIAIREAIADAESTAMMVPLAGRAKLSVAKAGGL